MKFKAGDRVVMKSLDQIKQEFHLDYNVIRLPDHSTIDLQTIREQTDKVHIVRECFGEDLFFKDTRGAWSICLFKLYKRGLFFTTKGARKKDG